MDWMLFTVVATALVFDFTNGFHDAANAIATSVSTRALSINSALILAAILNVVGGMLSTVVAVTIAAGKMILPLFCFVGNPRVSHSSVLVVEGREIERKAF
jgi:phosphate/sulfate permease